MILTVPADEVHPVDAPPAQPTSGQADALIEAQARAYRILGRWLSPEWRWFHAPGARRLGLMRGLPGERATVFMNARLSPAEAYSVGLHELAHVFDKDQIPTMSREESEARAYAFQHYAVRKDATMSGYQAMVREVEQLVAQGFSRTAAWQRVDPGEARLAPALEAGNGHVHDSAAPKVKNCVCGGWLMPASPGSRFGYCNHNCGRPCVLL